MEQYTNRSYTDTREYNDSFQKLMQMFSLSILISFLGTVIGMYTPPVLFLPLIIVELVMVIFAFWFRRQEKPVGYGFVYTFCLISGVTVFPAVFYYGNLAGSHIVVLAFLLTVLSFAGLTLYAYKSKRDFSFLGGFLMIGLLVLIVISIVRLFTGVFSSTMEAIIAAGGVLIFSGYILYDISRYKHGVEERYIPLAVMSLYLNFINLFLYILRLLANLSRR